MDFLRSHIHHDATDAHSKNEHERNLGTMKDLLLGNRPIVEKYFITGSTNNEQLALIFNELDCGECVATPLPSVYDSVRRKNVRANDFECHFNQEILQKIVSCINACKLFSKSLSSEEVTSFFDCSLPYPLQCTNLRLVSLFFDGLDRSTLITQYWQSVIERRGLLIKKNGKTPVSAHDLSSALSQASDKAPLSIDLKLIDMLGELYNMAHKND